MSDVKIRISTAEKSQFQIHLYKPDSRWLNPREITFLTRIPERKDVQGYFGTYLVAATDTTVDVLNACGLELSFDDDEAKQTFDYLKLRRVLSDSVQKNYANFKEDGTVPKHNLVMHNEHKLSAYQELGAVNCSLSEGYGLFMEQGTGKTAVSIADICNLVNKREPGDPPLRVIIVAPKNVRLNWRSEFDKFSTVKHKCTVLRGGQVTRIGQLVSGINDEGQDLSVIITSYETLIKTWDAISMIRWNMAVLDEGHYVKSSRTKRWEYCKKLRDNSDHRRVLTGTPIANSLMDLFTLFEFMGEGYSGFLDFKAYKKYYGVYKKVGGNDGYEALVAAENIPVLKDRLSRFSFMISKKEALPNLPDKVYDIEEVEMTEEQIDTYKKLASSLAVEIENDIEGAENPQLIVNSVLTKLLKLAQITSGFLKIPAIVDEDGEIVEPMKVVKFAPNPKIEGLMNLIKDKKPEQKTIIWACWIDDIKAIEAALRLHGHDPVCYYGGVNDDDREAAEWRFNNDPTCRFLIGNPAAGGTGLNLLGYPPGSPEESDTNCDHVIYFSQDWSSLKRSQSEDRAHRRGTRNPVRITDLCVPETIDELIRVRVLDKRRAALELTDIRDILKAVLQ